MTATPEQIRSLALTMLAIDDAFKAQEPTSEILALLRRGAELAKAVLGKGETNRG